jgi:hypothetical protein
MTRRQCRLRSSNKCCCTGSLSSMRYRLSCFWAQRILDRLMSCGSWRGDDGRSLYYGLLRLRCWWHFHSLRLLWRWSGDRLVRCRSKWWCFGLLHRAPGVTDRIGWCRLFYCSCRHSRCRWRVCLRCFVNSCDRLRTFWRELEVRNRTLFRNIRYSTCFWTEVRRLGNRFLAFLCTWQSCLPRGGRFLRRI